MTGVDEAPSIGDIKPPVTTGAPERKWDRTIVVPEIVKQLSKGGTPLNVILAGFDPPIHPDTLMYWRKTDAVIARMIDTAFELGSDRLAMEWLATAEGKTPEQGGRSTGDTKRDRLVTVALERLLQRWDNRYNPSVKLANDPINPVTNTKPRKPTGMTEDQLLSVAAQGIQGLAEAGREAAESSDHPDG